MRGVATFFGALILILIGIPLTLAVSWAVGLSGAALSDDFFPDFADKVVERVPTLVERAFEAAKEPGAIQDPNARAWVDAMAQVDTPLPAVLERSGFNAWLRDDLAPALRDVGRAVRGEVPADSVGIDMRGLKRALASPVVREYARGVAARLPACDAAQLEAWRDRAVAKRSDPPPPACNPGTETIERAFDLLAARAAQIPDREPLFRPDQAPPPLDFVPQSRVLVWLLFLAPCLVIALGAGLAGRGGKGFLGWSGGTVLTGGLLALATAWVAGGWLLPLVGWDPARWDAGPDAHLWTTEAGRLLARQVVATLDDFLGPLFGDVQTVGLGVSVVGLVFVILAMVAPRPARS